MPPTSIHTVPDDLEYDPGPQNCLLGQDRSSDAAGREIMAGWREHVFHKTSSRLVPSHIEKQGCIKLSLRVGCMAQWDRRHHTTPRSPVRAPVSWHVLGKHGCPHSDIKRALSWSEITHEYQEPATARETARAHDEPRAPHLTRWSTTPVRTGRRWRRSRPLISRTSKPSDHAQQRPQHETTRVRREPRRCGTGRRCVCTMRTGAAWRVRRPAAAG